MAKYWVIAENDFNGDDRKVLYIGRSLKKAKQIMSINKQAFYRIYITQVYDKGAE